LLSLVVAGRAHAFGPGCMRHARRRCGVMMGMSAGRVLVVAAACLICLSGCETSTKLSGFVGGHSDEPATTASVENPSDPATTASLAAVPPGTTVITGPEPNAASPKMLGQDPYDDLNLGKKYFRTANFGLAEKHFRRAVELHPRDADAWVGLAASYDRLKRFDLADRAYAQAANIIGDTPEIMNNKGFSYILRGDYVRARRILEVAHARAPDNPYIKNNLLLLEKTQRRGKAVN
jgi:Tetratricopeptide repeat